jgi:hypothetical protein
MTQAPTAAAVKFSEPPTKEQSVKGSVGIRGGLYVAGAAALLAGCGGSQVPAVTSNAPAIAAAGQSTHFAYTGEIQYFKVPAGVTKIRVDAIGARGGLGGGNGGRIDAVLPVIPGETLRVFVGGKGSGRKEGFNGGGSGGGGPTSNASGTGGGGASDLRDRPSVYHRILVAGGGGGAGGGDKGGAGGAGGGTFGGSGASGSGPQQHGGGGGGKGGTQHHGGYPGLGGQGPSSNGINGWPGGVAGGGDGVGCFISFCTGGGSGGGGGGYLGGGCGGSGAVFVGGAFGSGGGGGGGSSYAEPTAEQVHSYRGWKTATGNGEVTISWQ